MKEIVKKAKAMKTKTMKFIDDVLTKFIEENTLLNNEGRERMKFYLGAIIAAFLCAENKEDVDIIAQEYLSEKMMRVILISLKLGVALLDKKFSGHLTEADEED